MVRGSHFRVTAMWHNPAFGLFGCDLRAASGAAFCGLYEAWAIATLLVNDNTYLVSAPGGKAFGDACASRGALAGYPVAMRGTGRIGRPR